MRAAGCLRRPTARRQPAAWTDRRRLAISIDPWADLQLGAGMSSLWRRSPAAGIGDISSNASEGTLPAASEARRRESGSLTDGSLRARSWPARKDLYQQDTRRLQAKRQREKGKRHEEQRRRQGKGGSVAERSITRAAGSEFPRYFVDLLDSQHVVNTNPFTLLAAQSPDRRVMRARRGSTPLPSRWQARSRW